MSLEGGDDRLSQEEISQEGVGEAHEHGGQPARQRMLSGEERRRGGQVVADLHDHLETLGDTVGSYQDVVGYVKVGEHLKPVQLGTGLEKDLLVQLEGLRQHRYPVTGRII